MKTLILSALAGVTIGLGSTWSLQRAPKTQVDKILTTGQGSASSGQTETLSPAEPPHSEVGADATAPGGRTYSEILAIANPLRRSFMLNRFFEALPLSQFPEILRKVRANSSVYNKIHGELFAHWAERDPQDAGRQILMQLPPGVMRSEALFYLTITWAKSDPQAVRDWANKYLVDVDERDNALARASQAEFTPSIASQPKSLKEILALPDAASRSTALDEYFKKRKDSELPAALDEAMASLKQDRSRIGEALLDRLAKIDPKRALEWSREHNVRLLLNSDRNETAANILDTFVQKDPTDARGFVESLPPGRESARLFDRFIFDQITAAPEAIAALVEDAKRLNPTETMNDTLREWLRVNPNLATAELRRELNKCFEPKDSSGQSSFVQSVIEPWSQKDPQAVAEFCASLPKDMHSELFSNLATIWCAQDPLTAVNWAQSLPAGDARNSAVTEFTFSWAQHDSTQVVDWIKSLPSDAGRWHAVEGFAIASMNLDPDSALTWIRTIPSKPDRIRVLRKAYSRWSRQDQDTASQWLASAKLNAMEQNAINKNRE